jgi:O-antigen ligase
VELLKIIAYGSAFLLILIWVDDRPKLLRVLYLMIATGSLISAIGMVQRYLGVGKIYGFWTPFFRTDGSFFGPYVNPNHFAGYMALMIPLVVSLLVREIQKAGYRRAGGLRDHLRRTREADIHVALFLLLALVLMVSGLFVSLSRGGIFASVGSMIFLILILSAHGSWYWKLLLAVVGGIFVALFVFWLGFVPFEARIKSVAHLFQDPTVQFRLQIWKDSWHMLMDFPLFGTGLGTFAHIYPRYKTVFTQATVLYPESDFLEILVETGIVGFGVLVWFFVSFFRNVWIRWKDHDTYSRCINPKVMVGLAAALVAMLVHGIGDFNLHIPANALQFAMIMGLAMTVTEDKRSAGS